MQENGFDFTCPPLVPCGHFTEKSPKVSKKSIVENDTGKGSKTRLDRTFAGGYHCTTLSRPVTLMCLQWQAHGNYAHPGDISDDLSPPGGR
uniref:Uncharacterized protein n=1 Tax=Magallana gigas TaxID=29159 RepID=K1QMT3_MAGGI